MTNEQDMRRELLLIALDRCEDPGKALELARQMEFFIKDGGRAERTLDTDPRQAASSARIRTVKSPTRRRWAHEDDLRLRHLWAEGLSTQEIAERLQRTPASLASRRVFLKLGRRKPQRPKKKPTTAANAKSRDREQISVNADSSQTERTGSLTETSEQIEENRSVKHCQRDKGSQTPERRCRSQARSRSHVRGKCRRSRALSQKP